MLYNLVLVIFLSNGAEHRVPLIDRLSDDVCVDLRDQVRGQVDTINSNYTPITINGEVVEFVDAECITRKSFY